MPPLTAAPSYALRSLVLLTCVGGSSLLSRAEAHGISESSQETMAEGGLLAYVWLGAEHMVTGYDHLLFLFGVIFFLTGFKDIVRFITAFTVGHCITLLGATLLGVSANAYLIDAVIALSVVYKGFENLDGFKKYFGRPSPNLLMMVFLFGLIHGFGLSTRLQELPLGEEGIVGRILAFNVGVELGQIAALTVMLGLFAAWKKSPSFERFGTASNMGLVLAGAGLLMFQIQGYLNDHGHDDHAHENPTEHAHKHEEPAHGPKAHPHKHGEGGHDHGGHDHGGHDHGHEDEATPAPSEPQPDQEEVSGGHHHDHGEGGHTHGEGGHKH